MTHSSDKLTDGADRVGQYALDRADHRTVDGNANDRADPRTVDGVDRTDRHAEWMRLALEEARAASATGDVPVGAVLLDPDGQVLARGRNEREARHDPSAHAEIVALRQAASISENWHLRQTTLVVTLEPCVMCAGVIVAAQVARVVFGAWDDKAGAAGSVFDLLRDRRLLHRPEVTGGVLAEASSVLLRQFFAQRR